MKALTRRASLTATVAASALLALSACGGGTSRTQAAAAARSATRPSTWPSTRGSATRPRRTSSAR